MKKKKIKQICKNCKLFDPEEKICKVTIIQDGEYWELPTKPEDECHWIKNGVIENIQQIRAWSDGEKGYIEYS